MKKISIIIFLISCITYTFAQVPVIQWQKALGGANSEDANCIKPTIDGGYISIGSTSSLATGSSQVTGNHGSLDFWVTKIDDTGHIQWEKCFGGTIDDAGYSVVQSPDGKYIIAGSTESSDGNMSSCSVLEWDFWLAKLDDTGSIVWSNCYGGCGYSFQKARSVILTPDYNIVAVGESFVSALCSDHHGDSTTSDYWVIQVSSSGSLLWAKSYGGTKNDLGKCIQNTLDGGFIMIGSSNSNDSQVSGNHLLNPTTTSTDFWVVKLDGSGTIQWQKSFGGSGTDAGTYIVPTFDGGYCAVGSSNSLDTGSSQVTGNHGGYDYWVVKLNDTGAIQWQKSFGGSSDETATSIQQTSDSGYIICGYSGSIDGQVTGNHGGNDYWVVKISKNGFLQWEKCLGGSSTDNGFFTQQTADSGFIVAGGANSIDSEVTGNHGADDFWIVKLSACLLDSPIIVGLGATMHTTLPYVSYQWIYDGIPIVGATNATYTASVNGTYQIHVSDTNSCAAYSIPFNLTTLQTSSIANSGTIYIAPNPTRGTININGLGYAKIAVYNIIGQELKKATKTNTISLVDFPKGLYFIKLYNEEGVVVYENKALKI